MNENDISYQIRGAIFNVYNNIGPGLLEKAYVKALMYELRELGLNARTQVPLPFVYEDIQLDVVYKMDIVVEGKVIIEVKSVERLVELHHKQTLTYLSVSGLKLALLVNFSTDNIMKSIFRKVNGL